MAAKQPARTWIDCPQGQYARGPFTADRAARELQRIAADPKGCHYPHQLVTSDANPYADDAEG